jgi:hypothetical protein
MSDNARALVLRSINLPVDIDEQLRMLSFALRRPKADLMRWFIQQGLNGLRDRLQKGSSSEVDRISAEIASSSTQSYSERELEARERDLEAMQRAIKRYERAYGGG